MEIAMHNTGPGWAASRKLAGVNKKAPKEYNLLGLNGSYYMVF
jgi:hypothetical protein